MPVLPTPIGKVIFQHLDMAVLYVPNAKTASISYVYYRTIERRPRGVANGQFLKVTGNCEGLFPEYYANFFNKDFE